MEFKALTYTVLLIALIVAAAVGGVVAIIVLIRGFLSGPRRKPD